MENRIQLNANLRFAPSGELTSRDLLINFREQDLDRCCELVADFTKRFNLNLGLAPNLLPQPQATAVAVKVHQDEQDQLPVPRCPRCNVEMRRYASKFRPNSYWLGCPNFRVNGCLEKLPA
jgi:hypothetical protein